MGKIHDAVIKDDFAAITELLKPRWWPWATNINERDPNRGNETALDMASNIGRIAIVQFLLDRGANIDATDPSGKTALHGACIDNVRYGVKPEVAKLLLQRGANPNVADKGSGWTPLHYAANSAHPNIVEILLAHRANPNHRAKEGDTPLHTACYGDGKAQQRPAIAELLIKAGADVNACESTKGMTPLHYATDRGFVALAKYLIEKGAALNAKDKDGQTPLRKARSNAAVASAALKDVSNAERERLEGESNKSGFGSANPYQDVVDLLTALNADDVTSNSPPDSIDTLFLKFQAECIMDIVVLEATSGRRFTEKDRYNEVMHRVRLMLTKALGREIRNEELTAIMNRSSAK